MSKLYSFLHLAQNVQANREQQLELVLMVLVFVAPVKMIIFSIGPFLAEYFISFYFQLLLAVEKPSHKTLLTLNPPNQLVVAAWQLFVNAVQTFVK